MPELHVVAGANGVGKTTIFDTLIPDGLEYVNADLIAKTIREKAGGVNVQELANQEATDIFYKKVKEKISFSIETNLYDKATYKSFEEVQKPGYTVSVYFISVSDPQVCIDRVAQRVRQGGHNVNPSIVRERYLSGLALLKHYRDLPDKLTLFDNTLGNMQIEIILEKGQVIFQNDPCAEWVKTIMAKDVPKVTAKSKQSIDEVRKLYKSKGKGI